MAKLKETKKQLEALDTINDYVKLLKKFEDFNEKPLQPDITIKTVAAEGAKSQQLVLRLSEERVKQIIQSVAQPIALEVLTLSKKYSIELDEDELILAEIFKPVKNTRKKVSDSDAEPGDAVEPEDTEENRITVLDAE